MAQLLHLGTTRHTLFIYLETWTRWLVLPTPGATAQTLLLLKRHSCPDANQRPSCFPARPDATSDPTGPLSSPVKLCLPPAQACGDCVPRSPSAPTEPVRFTKATCVPWRTSEGRRPRPPGISPVSGAAPLVDSNTRRKHRFPTHQWAVALCSHREHGPPSSPLRITGLWLVWHFHDLISLLLRAHAFRTADNAAVNIFTQSSSFSLAGTPQDNFLVVRLLHPGECSPKGSVGTAK